MVFFLAGVHGVGKTSLCSKLTAVLGITSISAGQLIKEYCGRSDWRPDKKTEQILSNQQNLLSAVRLFEMENRVFLLDGHFALLDNTGEVTLIEFDVFGRMNLSAVVFIEDEPHLIAERLKNRDNIPWRAHLVSELQQAEKINAVNFCEFSGTPLMITTPRNLKGILTFITENIKRRLTEDHSKD
ncbi:AAA family ATPase [Pseudomonas moraviensis]|uniref:ATP-binding protein n=1 Tax=Pseudomonas moraviensis TaxID=321662 RepID=UPI00209384BF|nr:ATP-binding protein [Pseudomonas moraviensis]UST64019.1 ATP-binding protein [Pseudomonas moraviensis]UVL46076.1 AAA family ATPase [Pseudomonas moraviensis]